MSEPKCETGCMNYTGGEIKHHKDCVFYPESLAKMYDTIQSQLTEARERLDRIVKYCEPNTEFMWAASIVGIALDCDFRDAKQKIQEPNGKKDG